MTREKEIRARVAIAQQALAVVCTEDIPHLLSEITRLTTANAEQAARIKELEAERNAAIEHIKSYFDFHCKCADCANWNGKICSATGKTTWTYECKSVFRWRGLRREGEQG